MKYLLDTNICIYLLKHQPPSVIDKFSRCQIGDVGVSSITWAELLRGCGVYQPKSAFDKLRSLVPVVNFDENAAVCFAQLMKDYPHKPNFDTLIAAHAKSLDLILVSNNTQDFERFHIQLENWVALN
ncbi:type II toxin-antitoxin system VapC family toxin [Lonepinella sp. BR2271]|uniref:type II toxin-antitoxin system VapC family toxin n=1 Tax=Lonepinella sp. BR2271 TaxID=3434550 RepID=UPI003F6DEE36